MFRHRKKDRDEARQQYLEDLAIRMAEDPGTTGITGKEMAKLRQEEGHSYQDSLKRIARARRKSLQQPRGGFHRKKLIKSQNGGIPNRVIWPETVRS